MQPLSWCGGLFRVGLCVVALAGMTVEAQMAPVSGPARPSRIPRTPDGHPDLQGFWTNTTATPFQRPREFGDRSHFTRAEAAEYTRTWLERLVQDEDEQDRTAADLNSTYLDDRTVLPDLRTSLIVDPPTGRLPPRSGAAEGRRSARPPGNYDDPEARPLGERCILGLDGGMAVTPPIVPNFYFGNFYQIVQTRTHLVIFGELVHDARIVRVGGVHFTPDIPRWLGDSIARWDGDTLVIDTINISEKVGFAGATGRVHVVERLTRTGPSTIVYRATVEDPDTWSAPWTIEFPFVSSAQPPYEYACHEGNYAVEGVLRGARADEKAKAGK